MVRDEYPPGGFGSEEETFAWIMSVYERDPEGTVSLCEEAFGLPPGSFEEGRVNRSEEADPEPA